jgi:hypothetical protein
VLAKIGYGVKEMRIEQAGHGDQKLIIEISAVCHNNAGLG